MTHNKGYYREQCRKHIERKKRIIHEQGDYWHYEHEGELSKGKIHCSCPMCHMKTNNKHRRTCWQKRIEWKHSDLKKIHKEDGEASENHLHFRG